MARNDWCALVTDPSMDYVAWVELIRFGLQPYLPQARKRWLAPRGGALLMRRYPLFPRYVLLPIGDAKHSAIRFCRGVRKFKPILSDAEGPVARPRPGHCGREVEDCEAFDEVLRQGDAVQVAKGVLAGVQAVLTNTACNGRVDVLMPLFGRRQGHGAARRRRAGVTHQILPPAYPGAVLG
jgi:hypothetical protein